VAVTTSFAGMWRWTAGARSDPTRPPTPEPARIAPIAAEDAPCSRAATIRISIKAVETKLSPATSSDVARMNGCRASQERPSRISRQAQQHADDRRDVRKDLDEERRD